jgi:hypothetical protein
MAQLFGAPDDAQLMREATAAASDRDNSLEDRETALDNLEMLVENLDNANNIENLQLWEPILNLLNDDEAVIRKMTLWVIGTAVQNNDKAQDHFSSKEGGLSRVLNLVHDNNEEVALKAIYALSSALGHCEVAYKGFLQNNGWDSLAKVLHKDSPLRLRLRGLSVVLSLFNGSEVRDRLVCLRQTDIIASMIELLSESGHAIAQEKTLQAFARLRAIAFPFTDVELSEIASVRGKLLASGDVSADSHEW